jgi:hypothetical protein
MTKSFVLAITLVSAAVGGFVGAKVEGHLRDDDDRVMLGIRSINTAGLCVNALRALEEGRTEKQKRILEDRMEWSVSSADEMLGGIREPKIGISIPDLIEGVRRVRQYAESKGNHEVVAKCDRVLAALQRGTRA